MRYDYMSPHGMTVEWVREGGMELRCECGYNFDLGTRFTPMVADKLEENHLIEEGILVK